MKAYVILEDGSIFEGESFGWAGEAGGEVVFNTSLTGYQEILTDPSYKGQILVMTYPQIGNYGINEEDMESSKCHIEGFIVKEYSKNYSNFRATGNLSDFLKKHKVIGITGIETRAIVRKTRELGAMRGYITCGENSKDYLLSKIKNVPSMVGRNLASEVSTKEVYEWNKDKKRPKSKVIVIDCGVKYNILRYLDSFGASVTVVPYTFDANAILSMKPDGVLISNGPGDPAPVTNVIETIRNLLGKVPIFGICLGHQLLSLALGGKTYKLKYGHRGANHPVKNMETDLVEITSQNHGFAVDYEGFDLFDSTGNPADISHLNLNDNTVEGIECNDFPAFSVQYHPEASPGPHDAGYLFTKFFKMIEKYKKREKHLTI